MEGEIELPVLIMNSPYPLWDWRDMDEDWSMSEELKKRGYELSAVDYVLKLSRTFTEIEDYDIELQKFFKLVESTEIENSLEPYKIIITDNGFFLHCLIIGD